MPEVELCGATNPDYPGEYACTYPKGHGKISEPEDDVLEMDHGSPRAGAWWNVEPEPRKGTMVDAALKGLLAEADAWDAAGVAQHATSALDTIKRLRSALALAAAATAPQRTVRELAVWDRARGFHRAGLGASQAGYDACWKDPLWSDQ